MFILPRRCQESELFVGLALWIALVVLICIAKDVDDHDHAVLVYMSMWDDWAIARQGGSLV